MIREYETIFITHPDLDPTALTALGEKVQAICKTDGPTNTTLLHYKDWGVRKLAYEIENNRKGRYFFVNYLAESTGRVMPELERNLRYDEKVMRFLTVTKGECEDVAARVEKAKLQAATLTGPREVEQHEGGWNRGPRHHEAAADDDAGEDVVAPDMEGQIKA